MSLMKLFELGYSREGNYVSYRDKKLMKWTVYEPRPATASYPATTTWQARSSSYREGLIYGDSLDDLVKKIDAFVSTHPWYVNKTDAMGIGMLGIAGTVGGCAVAAGASLFGAKGVAKLGGLGAIVGLGLWGAGMALDKRAS